MRPMHVLVCLAVMLAAFAAGVIAERNFKSRDRARGRAMAESAMADIEWVKLEVQDLLEGKRGDPAQATRTLLLVRERLNSATGAVHEILRH